MTEQINETIVVDDAPVVDRFAGRDFQEIDENTVIPTAEELTKELIKEEEEKPINPEDLAAGMWSHYYPQYCAVIDTLSSASLKRILKGGIAFQAEQEPVYKDSIENELVNMMRMLLDARQTIILKFKIDEMKAAHEASTKAAQAIEGMTTSFSNEEEINTNKEI